MAIALTGLIHLSYLNLSPLTNVAEKLGLLVRNLLCVWLVASWTAPSLRRTAARASPAAVWSR